MQRSSPSIITTMTFPGNTIGEYDDHHPSPLHRHYREGKRQQKSGRRFSLPPEALHDDNDDYDDQQTSIGLSASKTHRARESTPSFSLHAPHCSLVDPCSSDDEAESAYVLRQRPMHTLPSAQHYHGRLCNKEMALEIAIAEQAHHLEQQLRLKSHKRLSDLQTALSEIDALERIITDDAVRKHEKEWRDMALSEAELAAQRAEERGQMLNILRIEHEQKAVVAAQQLALKEEEAKKKAELERQKMLHLLEKQRIADDAIAAEKRVDQEAKKKQQEEEQQQRKTIQTLSNSETEANHSMKSIAPSAHEFQARCVSALAAAQSAARPFSEDKSMRDIKRSIDKFITLNVQQISATLDQVKSKSQALIDFISRHHQQPQRMYALIALASKLLSQCEVQITRLHSFAFPLAEVATAVGSVHTEFVDILLARLHVACPLSVPLYYGFRSTIDGADEIEYLRSMGYKIEHDEDDGNVKKESTDDFVGRMAGFIMLYAAFTQSENPANPHGIHNAWEYVARLLNSLPANRLTAAALDAFLKVAGYKMAMTYRKQFVKLMMYVDGIFLRDLKMQSDPDARAVATRLSTYLRMQRYLQPPEGRSMPQYDASSYDRA